MEGEAVQRQPLSCQQSVSAPHRQVSLFLKEATVLLEAMMQGRVREGASDSVKLKVALSSRADSVGLDEFRAGTTSPLARKRERGIAWYT